MKYQYLFIILLFTFCSSKKEEVPKNELTDKVFTSPSGENASLPYLTKGEDNNLYLSWVEKGDSNWVEFKYSKLENGQWAEPSLISKGNDWFVNWADYPMMAVDKDGNMIAHYLAKSTSGTYSYDVNVVFKPSMAVDWSPSIVPHKDGTPTEHGFVTMLPQNDDSFLLSWLDGRNTGGGEHSEEGHGSGGAMTIRTAVLDMEGRLSNQKELDSRVCDCCQTGGTMTASGPVIVYRDRSMEEIRDMSFVRKVNNEWTSPKSIADDNWNIAGCPVNGPRVASFGGQFAAAWFTASNNKPAVKIAFSNGEAFNEPITVDSVMPLGRVDIVMLDAQSAMVSWMTNDDGKAVIKARKVFESGTMEAPILIAKTDGSRGSGFPQMELIGNQLFFAWTNLQEEGSSILMKKLSLD